MITVLAFLAVAPPSDPPGYGTRLSTELGATRYDAKYEANQGDEVGTTSVEGIGARLRTTLAFAAQPGLVLGPSLGFEYASVKSSSGICCGRFRSFSAARLGFEVSYYPSARVGFRINGGFGLLFASLARASNEVLEVPAGRSDIAATTQGIGSYFTFAVARDWAIGARSRIGGVIRIDADAVSAADGDRRFHVRALTPSLALVLVSGL